MKDALLKESARRAVKFFRTYFLANSDPIVVTNTDVITNTDAVTNTDLAQFLTAEGALLPDKEAGSFKISSPLVRWLILQRVIPMVFPSSPKVDIPFRSIPHTLATLDTLEVLKQSLCVFDKETMSWAPIRSFKVAHVYVNNSKDQLVPRESIYDAELYQILSNWLINFQITGQWHLVYYNNKHKHKYSDIVITSPGYCIVLELLATTTEDKLKEHFEQALFYAEQLSMGETWVINFTCEDNAILKPCWPTNIVLKKGLRVVHFWHNLNFIKVLIIACWWDASHNKWHITSVDRLEM